MSEDIPRCTQKLLDGGRCGSIITLDDRIKLFEDASG